jgi:hypothetical protein
MKHTENNLPTSYGEYLDGFAWEHFVTLTSARKRTPDELLRLFVDKFVRQLASVAQRSVCWFVAVEGGDDDRRPHLHAVVWAAGRLSNQELVRAWTTSTPEGRRVPLGRAEVDAYDRELRGVFYLTKELTPVRDWYDVSKTTPPRLGPREVAIIA